MRDDVKLEDVYTPEMIRLLNAEIFRCNNCNKRYIGKGKCECPVPDIQGLS